MSLNALARQLLATYAAACGGGCLNETSAPEL